MTYSRRDAMGLMAAAATVGATGLRADEAAAPDAAPSAPEGGPVVHEVQMLNKHPDDKKQKNVFLPDIVQAQPGDTIRFISVDKGHNSVSDKKMIPEGAEEWKSKTSKDVEITVTQEGTYGYYCTPHRSLGMVGLILVGDPTGNYEAAKAAKQKGKAKKVYKDIFERADALIAAQNNG